MDDIQQKMYHEELKAELAKLEEDQAIFPTEYKELRIMQLRQRLNLDKE